jgi:hypothetical protein
MVMSVQYAALGSPSQSQEEYDEAYRQWEVRRHIIRSQLEAYYPGSELGQQWDVLAQEVCDFRDLLNRLLLAEPISAFRRWPRRDG